VLSDFDILLSKEMLFITSLLVRLIS